MSRNLLGNLKTSRQDPSGSEKIYVKDTGSPAKGRGVFASTFLAKGELIECCPVIILPPNEIPEATSTIGRYYFRWSPEECFLPLGFTMLYNHSSQPNADWEYHSEDKLISFFAITDISENEEITYNYNSATSGFTASRD